MDHTVVESAPSIEDQDFAWQLLHDRLPLGTEVVKRHGLAMGFTPFVGPEV